VALSTPPGMVFEKRFFGYILVASFVDIIFLENNSFCQVLFVSNDSGMRTDHTAASRTAIRPFLSKYHVL
jgi:hypothetical protein